MTFRVALLDDYQGVALSMADWSRLDGRATIEPFREHIADEAVLAERLASFDAIMLMRERTKFPRSLIERLPNLKLLITAAMWNAVVDMDAATGHGIQVCGTGDTGRAAAELALGMMIALVRHIPAEDAAMRKGGWQTSVGIELHGKVLGIVGLGNLGAQMARFGQALGMEVVAWSENLTDEAAREKGARRVPKDELFRTADIVSIHLKLSPRTRGIVGRDDLARMKPTAGLVNTARGPIVDEEALAEALRERRIAGAALDVYGTEPLPKEHPFRGLDNVLVLPHVGYVTQENYRLIYGDVVEDIAAFLDGRVVRGLNQPPSPRRRL